nr:ArgK protein [Solirubrobacterales bacterium]
TVAVIVQPGSGDALQFLKSGIMEVPDVLVVTKADLGNIAMRARRDLAAALRAIGERATRVVAVSSVSPVSGMDELVAALDAHRETLEIPAVREDKRRASALADFAAEHGERGVRALGGVRAARRLLDSEPAGSDVPTLTAVLEDHARAR